MIVTVPFVGLATTTGNVTLVKSATEPSLALSLPNIEMFTFVPCGVLAASVLATTTGLVSVTFTTTAIDVVLVQTPFLQIAVYEALACGATKISDPVIPFDHITSPLQPDAVNLTVSPLVTVALLAVSVGAVTGATVIV